MTEIQYRTTAVIGRTADLADRGMRVVIEAIRRESGRMPFVIPAHRDRTFLSAGIPSIKTAHAVDWPVVIGVHHSGIAYPRHFAAIADYVLIAQEDGLALAKDRKGEGVPFPVVSLS